MRRGVTIVELLVAVGVIALLLALSVPALRGAFRASGDAVQLANLASTVKDFHSWAASRDDAFVNAGGGTAYPFVVFVYDGPRFLGSFPYDQHTTNWPLVLERDLGQANASWRDGPSGEPHRYSLCMVADPRAWQVCPWRNGAPVFNARVVRVSETAFPSQKALLCNLLRAQPAADGFPPFAYAFVDGSVRRVERGDIAPSAESYCGPTPTIPANIDATRDGILGRDVTH